MRRWFHVISLMAAWFLTAPFATGQTIAERIQQAAAGAEIRVTAGVYTEDTILLDKPLTLVGEPGAIIRGRGNHELVVIDADSVTIRGFRFENVQKTFLEDRAAIRVAGRADCRIEGNEFDDVFFGIYLAKAQGCVIRDNHMTTAIENETSGGNAIHSWYSSSLAIHDNTIRGFRDGIYLEFTDDSVVTGNLSTDNLRYGLHFMFSDRCAYQGNRFLDNRAGVAVMYADGILMHDNEFARAWGTSAYGLLLKEIRDGELIGNRFSENTTAVFMEATDRMEVSSNVFSANGWALRIMANALENTFTNNDFLGNTFDVTTNSRTAPSSFSGNYWDRYRGYDLDHDGVGDVAFRPVTLFSILAERNESALFLYRSILVDVLDAAERLMPALTPVDLVDPAPLMSPAESNHSDGILLPAALNSTHH